MREPQLPENAAPVNDAPEADVAFRKHRWIVFSTFLLNLWALRAMQNLSFCKQKNSNTCDFMFNANIGSALAAMSILVGFTTNSAKKISSTSYVALLGNAVLFSLPAFKNKSAPSILLVASGINLLTAVSSQVIVFKNLPRLTLTKLHQERGWRLVMQFVTSCMSFNILYDANTYQQGTGWMVYQANIMCLIGMVTTCLSLKASGLQLRANWPKAQWFLLATALLNAINVLTFFTVTVNSERTDTRHVSFIHGLLNIAAMTNMLSQFRSEQQEPVQEQAVVAAGVR